MDKSSPRYIRYHEKIGFILDSIVLLDIEPKTQLEKKGQYYVIQSIIDATIDIIAMIVKDIGKNVQDDYRNIEILIENNLISKKIGDQLNKANGLRNAITHHYNGILNDKIQRAIPELIEFSHEFIEKLEAILIAL